jgi:phage head maturation protease
MTDEQTPVVVTEVVEVSNPPGDDTRLIDVVEQSDIQVRSIAKREIDVRLLPWDTTIETLQGPEMFVRGAFAGVPNDGLLLMGLEHEASMGIGQDGRPVLTRRPHGRSSRVWEGDDGPYATFRVARTQSGDEMLALAEDRVVRGVSVEFSEVPGGTSVVNRNGRRVRVHNRVRPSGASMTYRPAYGEQAAVLAVRSQTEGDAPVAEQEAPVTGAETYTHNLSPELFEQTLARMSDKFNKPLDTIMDRLEKIEERARSGFEIPAQVSQDAANVPSRGEWLQTAIRLMTGERVPDTQVRALANLITTDNAGVVPDAFSQELIGVIDPSRPFMQSTRRLDTPAAGMSLIMPRIVTRPTVGLQAAEKNELTSTATSIDTVTYDAITVGGAGDISLQLLKRSSPSFLGLYLELLAEAYAINTEDRAVDALLAQAPVVEGGIIAPEDLELGGAWTNGVSARLRPDTIWMSTAAVAAFINAKAAGTNAPLYGDLRADFSAAGGVGGSISGLRPVHVPALDDETVKVIVGPSRGFAWTEDGTYTLQVDVPAKAGRDVALVGILWFAPLYPAAFTSYTLS